ncbi:MAG: hypothetical protein H6623_04385 [Bdellovibrionaceae bacterium]|nr:hypothetical protein [Pseudobdellovibrionaceae bacterium]
MMHYWGLFLILIQAQTTQDDFQRVYAHDKKICDMRSDTINTKYDSVEKALARKNTFEINSHAEAYERLLADREYHCALAQSDAARGNFAFQESPVSIPPPMYVRIPREKQKMFSELRDFYNTYKLEEPISAQNLQSKPEAQQISEVANASPVLCVPGGFTIRAEKNISPSYERDCHVPSQLNWNVFGAQQTVSCAPAHLKTPETKKYDTLSICHPMLYGVIPLKKDEKLLAQGLCAFPEDIDSLSFNRSQMLNKVCDKMSDYVASKYLPKDKSTRSAHEQMIRFIAQTNLQNYPAWVSTSQSIIRHCANPPSALEKESCVVAVKRIQEIGESIQQLQQSAPSGKPALSIEK